ncbi:hypothetical protein Tco_1177631, partial [Tanacetum coccineum]
NQVSTTFSTRTPSTTILSNLSLGDQIRLTYTGSALVKRRLFISEPTIFSPGYQNYPPQQLPPRNNHGWEQRPPTNMQGPPDQRVYDYYGGPPSAQPPMHSRAPGPAMGPPSQANYNYGQTQGPDYRQQPAPYSQTVQ